MRVTKHAHGLVLAQNAPDFVRSPGLHMSDIYNSLYKKLDPKRYDKRDEDGNPEELNRAKLEAGMGFEMRLEPLLDGERPGEFFTQHAESCSAYKRPVKDGSVLCHCGAGVAYSPDWLFYDPDEIVLGEFKFSWYSIRDFPDLDKFDKWITQVKAYCYHLKLLKARMYIYFVNGLYPRGAPSPVFEDYYEFLFTQREVTDEWQMLLRHAWQEGLIP